jgi:hypothetical protein
MPRVRLVVCLPLILIAAPVGAGCGSGDDEKDNGRQLSKEGDAKGAQAAVRDYLRALVERDGQQACARLSPDYRRSVLESNREYARRVGAKDCPTLVNAVTRQGPRPRFEGKPLTAAGVGKLKLKASVRVGGKEQNATVTGPHGLERYELQTLDGEWFITAVEQTPG